MEEKEEKKKEKERAKKEREETKRRKAAMKSLQGVYMKYAYLCVYFYVHTCMYIAAQKSRGGKRSVYTAANTERSGSRSSFDVDHELVTDSPGEQDGVELAGKQVWHSMASV